MDAMLSASDAWKKPFFEEWKRLIQFLVCNCADAFVSMIQSQQGRAQLLPESSAQRRFVDLQLLLIDDFRKRLAHIARQSESPWGEPFPNVMNAVWYLKHVVEEWSDSCLLGGITSTGKRAVFDESSAMFRHVWNQMAEDVTMSLRLQAIDMMRPYQQLLWCMMEPQLESLDELFKRMSSTLATVFTEEVVNVTPFSAEGASQMLFDVENGLIPIP
ncbi:RAD50-interacting protein 1 [Parelaphostrongylus tenuis]|uniref:RAD50-interacting protein 1 n=1 Tax=Parelaphostrongylus tenuis TaxID=148309 RepID=A0AAD5MRE2_PARTN|nr:RAD50-interacting protein 1 [Parelaphostrongylus tenuis]